MSAADGFDYQPFYCEENIWRLCQHPRFAGDELFVAIIANPAGAVRCRHQRAAGSTTYVDWDYHVVAFTCWEDGWNAWDFDSSLGLPTGAEDYLASTFRADDAPELQPTFRVMPGAAYVRALRSDRAHMRHRDGRWLQPPPTWAAPLTGTTPLMDLIDMDCGLPGEVLSLGELRQRLEE
ncbi:MAG: hypothetical protein H0W83_08500 [Planctomycetes bacterium]|nr:hypothetical protein [Planctomycetota bacterium]